MQKYFALLVILSLCLSSVSSVTVFTPITTQYAVCNAAFTFANTRLYALETTPTAIAINGVSYTNGASGAAADTTDSTEYRYTMATTTPWAITLSKTTALGTAATDFAIAPASTAAPVVIGLMRSVLVVKQTSAGPVTTYKAYSGSWGTASHVPFGITLSPPTAPATAAITNMVLVSVSEAASPVVTVYMEGTGATAWRGFYTYTLADPADASQSSTATVDPQNTGFQAISSGTFASTVGSPTFFYNKDAAAAADRFKQYTGAAYASVDASLIITPATDQALFYSLDNAEVFVVRTISNKQNAIVAVKVGAAAAIPVANIIAFTAANPVNVFSDGVKNLIAVTSNRIVWVYTRFATNTQYINNVAITDAAADDDIISASQISFTIDRAFALRPTKIVQYQVVPGAAPAINLLASISVTRNLAVPTAVVQWKGQVKCQCNTPAVKRFTCFTTTLGCLATVVNSFVNCQP